MKTYNFCAGPALLPEPVLRRAASELADSLGSGLSVMELSHRSTRFIDIAARAEASLRALLAIPSNYRVLFLQGGASAQFAMVPLNLLRPGGSADYVHTGEWSRKAIEEARKYGTVRVAATAADRKFTCVPARSTWDLDPSAAYVHVCTNETIGGVEFHRIPETGTVPLVADMSSHFLSRPVDVSRFGVIYAGAQKNAGPAGLTIVIVREDLLDQASPLTPSVFSWKAQAEADSMLNTPPTWAIYIAGLVFDWLLAQGGVETIEQHNIAKAALLYAAIDGSTLYRNPVATADRSRMNVPFRLADDALDAAFLAGAETRGLEQLKGHRSVGGMRASIYNAMPRAGVQALIDYLQDFERHPK